MTSWSERRAQVLEAWMQENTQLIDDFNWQFVAHDQREFLPRDLPWRGSIPFPGSLRWFLGRFLPPCSECSPPQPSNKQFCWRPPGRLLWIIILTVSNGVFVQGSISSSLLDSLARVFPPQATEVGLVPSRPSGWQEGNTSQPKQTAEQAGSKREEIVFS